MRVAAVDIGTNSVLLLIAERRGTELVPLVERATITRLGQGVDRTRSLAPEAIDRTLACLARYGDEIRAHGVERVDAVGTSAMRDAGGGEGLVARARDLLGVTPRVISGAEEAELTFTGALVGLALPSGPCVVFDVGGGSTEIIAGESHPGLPFGGRVESAVSLDVGSVRLTERHIRSDPPSASELSAVREAARAALAGAPRPRSTGAIPVVGVAGTVTTLAALSQEAGAYDGGRVHGARLSAEYVVMLTQRLASMSLESRRRLPQLEAARADVIVAGAILVEEILAWSSAAPDGQQTLPLKPGALPADLELIVSDRGVRWGLAQRLA